MKAATGEVVTAEDLGGGDLHSRVSGVTDHLADDDAHALQLVRQIVGTLGPREPRPWDVDPVEEPLYPPESIYEVVPPDSRTPYDVREVIARLVDGSRFAEFKPLYGHDAGHRLRPAARPPGRDHRQQRRAVRRVGAQGRALHRAVRPAEDPAAVPAEHHRLHGRPRLRGRRHRQARRQDGHCRRLRAGTEAHRGHRRLVRRRQLLDVRPGVLAPLPVHLAQRPHLGDGRRAGGQRAGPGPPRRRSRPAARSGRPRRKRRSRRRSATSTSSRATRTTPPPGSGTTA